MIIVYKVVNIPGIGFNKFISYATHTSKLDYTVNNILVPEEHAIKHRYGLCVFTTLQAAKRFDNSPLPIFECTTDKVYEPFPKLTYSNRNRMLAGEYFQVVDTYSPWPTGTVMVDKLILLRRVR